MKQKIIFLNLILVVFIGFFLRYYNNFFDGYWADEILTLEISNPSHDFKTFNLTWQALDGSPIFYFYFVKLFFSIFGFTPENGRLISIIFSTLAIFFSFFLFKSKFDDKISLIGTLIISLNLFLIWQSKDTRIPSSVLFFSIINIIYFNYFLKNKNLINIFILCFLNFLIVSYYPFTFLLAVSQLLFLFFLEKKINLKYLFVFLLSGIAYLYFNKFYIELSMARGMGHIGPINIKFFLNYFFSSFFGSIFFGGLILILLFLSFVLFFFKKKNFERRSLLIFHFILIFITYIFIIFYSLLKTEIAVPRYFIFLIPSIIYACLSLLELFDYRKILLPFIALTMINTIYFYEKGSIPKPPIKKLLKNMPSSESRYIFYNDTSYEIYFKNSEIIKKQFVFISDNEITNYNKIWFFCLNNPKSIVGNVQIKQDDPKCNFEIKNYDIERLIYINDFKIILFKKN